VEQRNEEVVTSERLRDYLLLAAVLLLAASVRLYQLGEIPNGFTVDEASYGYNGYSILKTGRDRFGEWLPLYTDNFGDLIESSYILLTVPTIGIFGLNEFATRLPAALIGIATVFALFKLAEVAFNRRIALLASLVLAISPWHVQVSRYAERSPLLPLLFCLALLFFFKSRKDPKHLYLSAFLFSLTLYTYASARVFVPLFLVGILCIFFRDLWQNRKQTAIGLAILLLCSLPAFFHWISPQGMARARYLLHPSLSQWLGNYASYFSPDYLFFRGDPNPRHSLLHTGQLHLFELVTVPAGVLYLLKTRWREHGLFWLWLLLYPLPAAFTASTHAIRTVVGVPLFAILSGCGLHQLIETGRDRARLLLGAAVGAAVAWNFVAYCERYFEHYPEYSAKAWYYGIREAITS